MVGMTSMTVSFATARRRMTQFRPPAGTSCRRSMTATLS